MKKDEECIVSLTHRRYQLLRDFAPVHDFLTTTHSHTTLNSHLLPPFFEYAHTHPAFNHKLTHRFGLWEDQGEIVGVACYEMDGGEAFLVTDPEHAGLLPVMLLYAEKELSARQDGKHTLSVWVTDKEADKIELLLSRGYERVYREPVRVFPYSQPFLDLQPPPGFTAISLEEEDDPKKINDCL